VSQSTRKTEGTGSQEVERSHHQRPDSPLKADNGRRITAVLATLNILCPDADLHSKRKLAKQILTLVDGHDRPVPQRTITDAQVVEMVWRHSQCVLNQTGKCPLLVFGRQLAEETNEFFADDE
jgi:hypothetical protein